MKRLAALFLSLAVPVMAGDITPGITLSDGQRLTAAELAQLVNQATINTSFYTSQVAGTTNLQVADTLLIVSSGGGFKKILGSAILNNTLIFTGQATFTNIPPYATLLYYDPTNAWLAQITASNFDYDMASNLPVQLLVFTKTNSLSTNNLVQVLPTYAPLNVFSTNNQQQILIWDTNGVPSTVTLSNLTTNLTVAMGTNFLLPLEYTNTFFPWLFLNNTNATTNAYGSYTNFSITNLFFTNASQTNPAYQTLTNSDTIPILAASQKSNTTLTLEALYEYLTNRNTLPAYALARMQFNGSPLTCYAQKADQINKTFQVGTNGISGVQAVSFLFSATSANSLPTSPQVTSNSIYYAIQTGTNTNYVQLYTNYNDAAAANTNVIVPNTSFNAGGTTSNGVLILTNYTRYNADAIALSTGASIRTGVYDVYYRTNLTTTNYYVTGVTGESGAVGPALSLSSDNIYSSNRVRICFVWSGVGFVTPTRTEILIQPE